MRETMYLATTITWLEGDLQPDGTDSRLALEALGFEILSAPSRNIEYEVLAPEGWTSTHERLWTFVNDETGFERIRSFAKYESYERESYLNIAKPPA